MTRLRVFITQPAAEGAIDLKSATRFGIPVTEAPTIATDVSAGRRGSR